MPSICSEMTLHWVHLSNQSNKIDLEADQLSLRTGKVSVSHGDDNCIFYPALLWKLPIKYNSDRQSTFMMKLFIGLFILSPFVWFSITVAINSIEATLWDFSYTSLLWIVYFIATFSVVLDCAINLLIVKDVKGTVILNNVIGDFVVIALGLSVFLLPLMVKESMEPDDAMNRSYLQMSVNLMDGFALLALSTSNIIFNNLIGAVISQTIIHQQVYFDETMQAKVDKHTGKVREVAKEVFRTALKRGASAVSIDDTRTLDQKDVLTMTRVVDRMVDEIDLTTPTGRFRFYLRLKMLLNIASSTLFLFYTNVYLTGDNASMIFVLDITILSFLNNLTSTMCVRLHDKAVHETYTNEKFRMKLQLGEYGGFDHVQFYYTLVMSLLNVILRASSINYTLPG